MESVRITVDAASVRPKQECSAVPVTSIQDSQVLSKRVDSTKVFACPVVACEHKKGLG